MSARVGGDVAFSYLIGQRVRVFVGKGSDGMRVGGYTRNDRQTEVKWTKTSHLCPICESPLRRHNQSMGGRVTAICGPVDADGYQRVVIDPVPDGYTVVSCDAFKSDHYFTMREDQL